MLLNSIGDKNDCIVFNFILIKTIYLFVFIVFFIPASLIAQQNIKITGRVIDDLNEEALPFTSVFMKGTTKGTVTDFDGYFNLNATRLSDSLVVTAVGYKRVAAYISNGSEQVLNFRLRREDFMMEEVTVYAGENPAHRIMRNIIANKDNHDINSLPSYRYETYNKLEIDLFNISDDFKNKKLFKPFQFIFDNIDSVSEKKPFLPIFLTETLSDYYYLKSSGAKEVIRANRISGEAKNESVTQFLGNMYQKTNIYDNFMPVMGKNIPSPINNSFLAYYDYYLLDSATIGHNWCYKLRFKPKMRQQNAFEGDFWVADTSWAVQRISMELQAKEANINWVNRMSIYQEYVPIEGKVWALKKDKLVLDFLSGQEGKNMGIIGRKSTSFSKFETNVSDINKVLSDKEDIAIAEDVYDKNEDFWNHVRPDSLSKNEKQVYAMIDTLKKMPIIRTYIDMAKLIVSGYYTVGKIDIGPYFKLGSWNQVDSWRLRLGGRTNWKMSRLVQVEGYAAYGFKSHKIHYGGDVFFLLKRTPRQTLRLRYRDDKDIEAKGEDEFGQDNILAGFYRNLKIPQKLIHLRDASMTYSRDWRLGWSNTLSISNTQYDPYFEFYYFPNNGSDAQPRTKTTTTELKLGTRFAYKEKFISDKFKRVSLGTSYPVFNLTYAYGFKGVLGSNTAYHKVEVNLSDWFYIGSIGYTEWELTAGKIFGTLPFILLENFPGNETYFYNDHSFNRLNEYEFTADTYATLFWTHHFEGFFFNRVPLLRKLKLRELISARMAAGSISSQNVAYNTDPNGIYKQFAKEAEEFNSDPLRHWQPIAPDWKKPYVELSVGVENILKLFRIDFIWRTSYTNTPQRVGIRTGMQLKF